MSNHCNQKVTKQRRKVSEKPFLKNKTEIVTILINSGTGKGQHAAAQVAKTKTKQKLSCC